MPNEKKQVVVLGAGIAGLYCARQLAKKSNLTVTLVSDREEFIFLPRLTEVLGKSAPPERAIVPLKDAWKGAFEHEKANLINPAERTVILASGKTITYDILIVAIGSQTNTFGTPGSQYAYPFYTHEDEQNLHEHVERMLEADEQPGTHTFCIVGGGPTGVEVGYVLGRMTKEKRPARKVLLLDNSPTILRVFPQKLQDAVRDAVHAQDVTIMNDVTVKGITPMSIDIEHKDGSKETIPCFTTVWAAGSKPQQIALSGIELSPKGEIPVEKSLQVPSHPEMFAAGDIAAAGCPKTAQAALQQAQLVVENVLKFLAAKPTSEFTYNERGTLIALEKDTVGIVYGALVKGFVARTMRDARYRMVLNDYR